MYQNLSLLNDIIKLTPLGLAVYTGEDLTIELANPAMLRSWGKGSDVVGKKYGEFTPEIHPLQLYDKALEVYKTGIPFHDADKAVELVTNGSPKKHYFKSSFIPLYNEMGVVYGVMNTVTDITALHNSKHETELSEESLNMAIESSGLGFYQADFKTKEVRTCGNFNDIWSIEKQDISSPDLTAKIHPDDNNVRIKAHEKANLTQYLNYEARIIDKDNSARWVKISGRYFYDAEGSPEKVIGVVQDIQAQKEFEQELKDQIQKNVQGLQRSNEDLLQFANIVSHDLREPIRKIKFFQDLLRKKAGDSFTDDIKKYFDKINYSAERMDKMIEGVLAYSTLNNPGRSIKIVNLNDILNGIKTDLELLIMETKAVLLVDELPKIEGSAILIHQLFYNLIQNSLKFSKLEIAPCIKITSEIIENKGGQYVQIIVKDNGIGLDPAYGERIFKEFERLHSKDDFEGNGLGLALCKKIVQRHNGSITATGQIDNGAEFTVILPIRQKLSTI